VRFHSSPYESIRITSNLGPLYRRRRRRRRRRRLLSRPSATLQIAVGDTVTESTVAKVHPCVSFADF